MHERNGGSSGVQGCLGRKWFGHGWLAAWVAHRTSTHSTWTHGSPIAGSIRPLSLLQIYMSFYSQNRNRTERGCRQTMTNLIHYHAVCEFYSTGNVLERWLSSRQIKNRSCVSFTPYQHQPLFYFTHSSYYLIYFEKYKQC